MADQAINTLPKKTTVADTDALLMIGTSEEYQIDYGELADAILNKITSKSFTLDQGSKTLVAALNELNSNTKKLSTYNIPKPSDIDGATISIWTVIVKKVGRITSIQFNIQGDITKLNTFITLFNLEEKYRPLSGTQHNYITQNGIPMILSLNATGDVQIYANGSNKIENTFFLRQCITYIN